VPAGLGLLTSLRLLLLYHNLHLTHVPAELGLLTELTDLYLHCTPELTIWPAKLGLLTGLRILRYDEVGLLPIEWQEGGALELSGCYIYRSTSASCDSMH
jgi:hypothetical protein